MTLIVLTVLQFFSLMETIDRQKEEMGRSSRYDMFTSSDVRSTSAQIAQLQEALNERKSAINSLAAKLQMTEAALALSEQKTQSTGDLLSRMEAEREEQKEQQSRLRKKQEEELSRTKAASVTGWAQAEEELGKVRAQMRLKEAMQLHCSQQKQAISELQAKNSHQSIEMDGLRRWIEELQQVNTQQLLLIHPSC
ncbi:hypothetical protein GOODEAATRI_029041 [Goodea atripinnis]|uniref:Uncharacterized protein n=1 Tax=Goodea atripinnis TaxID=208336 RepID=A0ABV0NYT1_9TELE